MRLEHSETGPLVLFGGSGVVGRELVSLLGRHDLVGQPPIVIVGRDAERAAPVIAAYQARGGQASFAAGDLSDPAGLPELRPRAIVTLVNDPSDGILDAAVVAGIPYVDIARWTARLASSSLRLAMSRVRSPVVLSSAWMGGLAPRVAHALGETLRDTLDTVDIAVRYGTADSSGRDSVEFMDRLATPFDVTIDARPTTVMPLSDGRLVDVGGALTKVSRLDTPEQATLPITLGVRTAALRIGFDNPWATLGLHAFVRLGVYCALRGDRFTALRHSLLRSSDADRRRGCETRFRVDVRTSSGATDHATIIDPQGQAHLTAVGALLSLRTALDERTEPGVLFPEQDPANGYLFETLAKLGIDIRRPSGTASLGRAA